MGPPVVQRAPAVPKMGVRSRVSDRPQRRETWDAQPPPRYDSLAQSFLNGPPQSDILLKSLDPQIRSATRYPVFEFLSHPPSRSLFRMKRSNSEVTISDVGAEDLDPAAINPNTRSTLRRVYGSTSTLDQHASSGLTSTLMLEEQPSAAPPVPEALHFSASLSPSLETTTRIAQGDVVYVPRFNYVDSSVFYSSNRERLDVQKNTMEKVGIFSRLRGQRGDGDQVVQQVVRFSLSSQRCFSHHDVQSVLFSIGEFSAHQPELRQRTRPSTGLLAASQQHEAADPAVYFDVPPDGSDKLDVTVNTLSDDGDGKNSGLVLSCPLFVNEIGGEMERKLGLTRTTSTTHSSRCTNAAVSVLEVCRENQVFPQNLMRNHDIEHIDLGAKYYLKYFYNRDHKNYFGVDEDFGPVALSVRREKVEDKKDRTQYNYRIILRTSQLSALRGSVLEDSIPSSSKHGSARGVPLKDVLEFVVPELNIHNLRLATSSPKVPELLLQLDQQELSFQHKVHVLFCRTGLSSEDKMYETSSPALDQFLDLLGHKVQLKRFSSQLDTTGDSTGSHSVYTKFREFELMFHVSALQPNTANTAPQQLLHKYHEGNDIITVIFQEPDAPPFSPKNICSHFEHVFIIVRVHRPCSQHTCYSIAVSRHRDVPSFGPLIPAGWLFPASSAFRDFLLTKIINAQHALHRSEKFVTVAMCRRQERLKELVENFVTSTPVDTTSSVRFSFISLGGKKKERSTPSPHAHLQSSGGTTWRVTARDSSQSIAITCRLAISTVLVVLIDEANKEVVFNCYCRDVIGWNTEHGGIKLFYEHGDCVMFSTLEGNWEDVREISQRLQLVSGGAPAAAISLRRNRLGQLGFHVNFEGVVADVEVHGFAWQAGLRPGCRLMEICSIAMVTLSQEQMIELLRTSTTVTVVAIPPNRDGTPRRSFSEIYRVPIIKYETEADVPSCSFRETQPIRHLVSAAHPTSRATSNQNEASESVQQLVQIKPSSSFDMKEESRMPQEFCNSLSSQSTSSDPGPPLTPQSHAHCRSSGPPDWFSSDGGTQSTLERTGSTETLWLHHHHHQPRSHHRVKKVLRELHSAPAVNNQHKVNQINSEETSVSEGQSCSSGSCSNTLSSVSSDNRHSEHQGLTFTKGASTDSGIDSSPCIPLAPPPVAGATLVLRDVWREGAEGGLIQEGVDVTTSAGHLSDTCCPSSLTEHRNSSSSSRPQLFTSDLQPISRSMRDIFSRMIQSDVTAAGRSISRVSGVPPLSPWRSLTRAVSDDSLYRRTLSLTSSRSSLLLLEQLRVGSQRFQRSELCHSESSLAERSKLVEGGLMLHPHMLSHLDWSHLVDTARAFQAGAFSSSSLSDVHQEKTKSYLQDSDITAASLSGKVFRLEEILYRLRLDLLKEQQDKAALQQQVLNLRQDNLRLQEESQSTADQIRKFTVWMLHGRMLP